MTGVVWCTCIASSLDVDAATRAMCCCSPAAGPALRAALRGVGEQARAGAAPTAVAERRQLGGPAAYTGCARAAAAHCRHAGACGRRARVPLQLAR